MRIIRHICISGEIFTIISSTITVMLNNVFTDGKISTNFMEFYFVYVILVKVIGDKVYR